MDLRRTLSAGLSGIFLFDPWRNQFILRAMVDAHPRTETINSWLFCDRSWNPNLVFSFDEMIVDNCHVHWALVPPLHSTTVADKRRHQIWYLKNMNFLGKTNYRFELVQSNRAFLDTFHKFPTRF